MIQWKFRVGDIIRVGPERQDCFLILAFGKERRGSLNRVYLEANAYNMTTGHIERYILLAQSDIIVARIEDDVP